MIDLMLDYALYNFCGFCNFGNFSQGASTISLGASQDLPRELWRALSALMDQNPSQIKPNPAKIKSKSSQIQPKSNANPNQIKSESKSNLNPGKSKSKANPNQDLIESQEILEKILEILEILGPRTSFVVPSLPGGRFPTAGSEEGFPPLALDSKGSRGWLSPTGEAERSGAERGRRPRSYEGSPRIYHRFSQYFLGFPRISYSCIIDFLGFPRISIGIL